MFRGADAVAIDEKGRFAVPARYRAWLHDHCAGALVVTLHHQDACLLIYPKSRWEQFEQQLLARGGLNPDVRRLQRHFVGNARDLELDKQGRVLLPQGLKSLVQLESRAALVGMGHSFELWTEDAWTAQRDSIREQFTSPAGGALPPGLDDLPL